jgi:hypothetical protein
MTTSHNQGLRDEPGSVTVRAGADRGLTIHL